MKRHDFSKRKNNQIVPNLIEIQINSYNDLLKNGIAEVLDEIGPVEDFSGRGWVLELSDPSFDKPNISMDEALYKGRTYDAPWYLNAEMRDPINNKKKKQKIYMGDIPLMTPTGTFIINGVERIVVSQLKRSEGVLFTKEIHPSTGAILGGCKILPKNGAWLEVDTTKTGLMSVKIDRRRKIPVSVLLRIFGLETNDDIRAAFEDVDSNPEISFIESTLSKDPSSSYNEAILEIYKKMRPGEPLVLENARSLVQGTFFNRRRYSLGKVGRFKMNQVLGLNFPNEPEHYLLHKDDLVAALKKVININNGIESESDLDHLSNRRVRSVGELLQDEIRIGFLRMERNIKERMSLQPREEMPEPSLLISSRTVASAIHSFFATGQLSQHHDQQNPVTALDHLRRLSVTGPGGLTKERASMSVRDVHYSSFGKICPVRTPEGPNIGLINYIASYARVNEYGFLETPYVKLEEKNGKVRITDEVVYLAAYDEELYYITDSTVSIDEKGFITQEQIPLRKGNDFTLGSTAKAQYMELVPGQAVGIMASQIPFLANDDISRALMGTQQMSQAVPLVKVESPIIATGLESDIARNSGIVIVAEDKGEVLYADSTKVKVKYEKAGTAEYLAKKFVKSNSDTSLNQRVKVSTGQKIKKGDIILEGPASQDGEIALGANLNACYMIFEGYEFEDGIILSDRLVTEDVLTSVHIENYKIAVLETKLGPEELTFDIPNISEEALRNLNEDGIISIGAKVKAGDILVGKVAPKGEVELSAEERLLRAIFGEKAKEVRDTSLILPHGKKGVVIGVKRVSKKENSNLPTGVIEEITVYVATQKKIQVGDKLSSRHGNKGVISAILPASDMPHLEDGTIIDVIFSSEAIIKRMNMGQLLETPLSMAGERLGRKYIVPNFEEVPHVEIDKELQEAGIPLSGKMKLIDGRTGEYFDNEVVVGSTYILKLVHMSSLKMHARSTGPYSLITQQPLGGKSQMGGQRFGEMEVWALEAYGAAHILKEMLTIKSDDWLGRTQAYKAILQGQPIPESNVPESFKLLIRELNGLCLNISPSGSVGTDSEDEVEDEIQDKFDAAKSAIDADDLKNAVLLDDSDEDDGMTVVDSDEEIVDDLEIEQVEISEDQE
ncbi:DNA-directed RNA polymerase subunit beta [Candidatus Nomurabacteria bacterium]|nr:DNA-directed RNA polymerase subunit beta [Candidatus Nomurabacteria bacterium]MCB9826803.1 DNA-directed RNA polymerase subunit beta [Candidatus Nomurabacteria bacterium]MCB9827586.1 DNA-directed RNA polymerase subunit beta [Candidatus Nomurabacteria bacterium]